jgi:hypothetical protein
MSFEGNWQFDNFVVEVVVVVFFFFNKLYEKKYNLCCWIAP